MMGCMDSDIRSESSVFRNTVTFSLRTSIVHHPADFYQFDWMRSKRLPLVTSFSGELNESL